MAATLSKTLRPTGTIRFVHFRSLANSTREWPILIDKRIRKDSVLHNLQAIAKYRYVKHFFKRQTPASVYSYAQSLLNKKGRVRWTIRSRFYTLMIRTLLNRKEWELAYKLHLRMRLECAYDANDLMPELLIASRGMPAKSPAVDELIAHYVNRVHKPDDKLLKVVIGRVVRQRGSPEVVNSILKKIQERQGELWTPDWELCSLMAQAEAQSGTLRIARRWFEQAREQIGRYTWAPTREKDSIHTNLQVVYTRFLLGLSGRKGYTLNNALKKMQYDQVFPSRVSINQLIAKAASHGRADGALALYRAMRNSRPPIPANKHTFYHLFSASAYAVKTPWLFETGGRRLYRDMARQHLSNTNHCPHKPSNAIDYFTLNAALRHFLRERDYAAATVTMRSFRVCNITPTLKTQEDVFESIISRIKAEILNAPPDSVLWSDKMLGEVTRCWHWDNEQRVAIMEKLHRALSYVKSSFTGTAVDVRYLLALLRRAVLSSEPIFPGKDPNLDERIFEKVMKRARNTMLPPKEENSPGWFMAATT